MTITGMEYHFRQTTATESTRTAVYNFLIVPSVVPGRGIYRDITGVDKAAEDYQRRFFRCCPVPAGDGCRLVRDRT